MKILDPGHMYELSSLDDQNDKQLLRFVKREGSNYPGNVGHYPGTTTQEVLRALIDRTKYVDNQVSHNANEECITYFRLSLMALEERAAERHGMILDWNFKEPIEMAPVKEDGHMYWRKA